RLRRMVAPIFGGARDEAQGEAIRQLTLRRSESWPDRSVVAVQDELLSLTLDVILLSILGGERSREYQNIRTSCAALIHLASTSAAFQRDHAGESGLRRRLERDLSEYNSALQAEIASRRRGAPRSDFLGKLME